MSKNGNSTILRAVTAYKRADEHLEDELSVARGRVRALLERRSEPPSAETNQGGDGGTIPLFAASRWPSEVWTATKRPVLPAFDRSVLDARVALSREAGLVLPVADLVDALGLSPLEQELLLLLLALELDGDVRDLIASLSEGGVSRRPDIGFLAGLFANELAGRTAVLDALSAGRALRDFRLVHTVEATAHEGFGVFNRPVTLHPEVVRVALFGPGCELDELVGGFATLRRPTALLEPWIASEPDREQSTALFDRARAQSGRLRLIGPRGSGKKHFLQTMLRRHGEALLVVDVPQWLDRCLASDGASFTSTLDALLVAALLRNATLCFDVDGDERFDRAVSERIHTALCRFPGMVAVADTERRSYVERGSSATEIAFAAPAVEQRVELWRQSLGEHQGGRGCDVSELAEAFVLSGGQIAAAVELAIQQAGDEPETSVLRSAARRQVASTLAGLAARVDDRFEWSDVVLPEEVRRALEELRAFALRRKTIFDEWGFGAKFPSGRGLTALFSGQPGTGKTMVASILARELGLELYRVDLSRVVSKWVGETEKNLARIFGAAENAQALLLFDEADALFSTRTEVRSSNDRYGNLEVNRPQARWPSGISAGVCI